MDEYDLMAAAVLEDCPPAVPCSQPDLGIVALASAIADDGYVVVAIQGGRVTCAILPVRTVLDPEALRAALAAGIGSDGPMGRAMMCITTTSTMNIVHVAAVDTVEALRAAGADGVEVAASEMRAVAAARAGDDASARHTEEDPVMGSVLDHVGRKMMEQAVEAVDLADPIYAIHDDIAEVLHLPTLGVLAWSPSYTAMAYEWYRTPGAEGRRRRMAGYCISGFAGLVGDDATSRATFDAGGTIEEALAGALSRYLGREFTANRAAAIVNTDFEPPVYARRLALHALAEMPAESFPRSDRGSKALVAVAWGLRTLWSPDRPGSFASLIGNQLVDGWPDLSYGLSQAGIDPIPTMDQIQDTIEARAERVGRAAWLFATLAGMPALILAGGCEPFSDEGQERAVTNALRLFSEGRDIQATFDAVAALDEIRDTVHLAAISGGEGANLTWPALHEPVRSPNGLNILPLHDLRAIHDEGRPGPDAEGFDGLDNGASTRAAPSAFGQFFLSSARAPDGRRLGTMVMRHDGEAYVLDGLGGPLGQEPQPEVWAAAEWLVASLNDGSIPTAIGHFAKWVEDMDPVDGQMAACGYDWRHEGNVRKAVDAFRPYLSPAYAGMPYEELGALMAAGPSAPRPQAAPPVDMVAITPAWSPGRAFRRLRRRLGALIAGIEYAG